MPTNTSLRRWNSRLQIMRTGLAAGLVAAAAVVAGLTQSGCTIRTPSTETPVPNDTGVEKSFFVNEVTAANGQKAQAPKTFLCGWAPITESGAIASSMLTHAVHMAGHCNMEFEVTEQYLIGRLVNPSFPQDRTRWKQALLIPIRQHYYYERSRDSYGRETNAFVENSQRSHWSARPQMQLDLSGVRIQDWDLAMFYNSRDAVITSVTDIEWDRENNFLGFTAVAQNPHWGSTVQARLRFNFRAFQHNPRFEKTPWTPANARHLNALHVIGEKVEGLTQVWSAAKWDLSKTHDVYTYGFPEDLLPMAEEVVASWNEALAKIGKPKAFRLNRERVRYPFDLRKPMMVWVDDPQISAHSPLGVGMAQADVRNGEILWGQITMYGGMLERYIKSHLTPLAGGHSGPTSRSAGLRASSRPSIFPTYFNPTRAFEAPAGTGPVAMNGQLQVAQESLNTLTARLAERVQATGAQEQERQRQEQARLRAQDIRTRLVESLTETTQEIQARLQRDDRRTDLMNLFAFPDRSTEEARRAAFGPDASSISAREMLRRLNAHGHEHAQGASGRVVHDLDRRLMDVGPQILAAIETSQVDYETAMKRITRELIMHEFGHMIGLGHQFKENILPAEGTVPEKYRAPLVAAAQKNWTNSTSVMGYKHPFTEIAEDGGHEPGPQDLLVLRYLYNGEYATYKRGDEDFIFHKLPPNGVIPARHPERQDYVTSYFPQCNDFDASFAADPYCNRFDRGYNAESIVKSYFEDLNANMVSKIYAFTDSRGGDTEGAEGALWWRALTTLGRVRIFYDHMRSRYDAQIREIAESESDLYEFSRACDGENIGSAKLRRILNDNPGLAELCKVNRLAVKEMMNLLVMPGPDRSRMNWDDAVAPAAMTGGDADMDYSRAFGTHSALSVLPLKLSAINALTTPYPYAMLGGWMFPIPRYTGQDGLFSYSSLYPIEFTEALAVATEKNLKFVAPGSREQATMGLPIVSMGYFIDSQRLSNDSTRFPRDFIENIRSQTEFRLSLQAIILHVKTREDKTQVTHFEAELYDPRTDKTTRVPEAFMLPGGKLIVRPPSRNFVYPLTKLTFLSDEMAFAWGYRVEYDDKHDDVLAAHSVKASLEKLHNQVVDQCLRGPNNNGLASHFNAQQDRAVFAGFQMMSGIAADKEKQIRFLDSVKRAFDAYEQRNPGQRNACEQSLRGVGLIVSSSAVVNGYWLPEVLDYLVK